MIAPRLAGDYVAATEFRIQRHTMNTMARLAATFVLLVTTSSSVFADIIIAPGLDLTVIADSSTEFSGRFTWAPSGFSGVYNYAPTNFTFLPSGANSPAALVIEGILPISSEATSVAAEFTPQLYTNNIPTIGDNPALPATGSGILGGTYVESDATVDWRMGRSVPDRIMGFSFTAIAIPEPSAFSCLGLIGLVASGRSWWKRRRS